MKKGTHQVSQKNGKNNAKQIPYYLEAYSTTSNSKLAQTQRHTTKNPKHDLLEYFKKERNTLTQVSTSIRNQLQQSRSIEALHNQKSERLKTLPQNVTQFSDKRLVTEDGNSGQKKQQLKGKYLSLALEIQKRDLFKTYQAHQQTTTTKHVNIPPSSYLKQIKHGSDLSIKSGQSLQQQYYALKSSIQSDASHHKNSIEDILGDYQTLSSQKSKTFINQSKNDSIKLEQQDSKKQLQIILHYKQQKYSHQFEFLNKTTDDLYNYLIQQIAQIERQSSKSIQSNITSSTETDQIQQEINKICQFQTVSKNIPFDYYLSLNNMPLSHFQGQTLQLQPLHSIPLSGKRIGLRDFLLVKCIGVGGFSRVYLVRKRDDGKFYALKLIDKKFISENQKEIIVQNERDIMVKLDNQFITPLQYAFETKYYIAFVLDYCAGGELFYHLRRLRRLSEVDAKFYFVEICIGMAYLHSQNIVYRDIKPENILLDLDGHLLLSDFGLSKPDMSSDDLAFSFCGSPEYMAPEMLMKTGHNYMVDCYCLGALLYELVTGLPPFYSHNTQEIYNSILTDQIQFPSYVQVSNNLRNLIEQLIQKDPNERLGQNGGIVEILTHPWFADVEFEGIVNKKLKPPYRPEPLKYNFDEVEFTKGDAEFRKQYQANLQKEYSSNESNAYYILKNFYYAREQKQNQQRTNIINLKSMQASIQSHAQSPTPKMQQTQERISSQEGKRTTRKPEQSDFIRKHEMLGKPPSLPHAYSLQNLKGGHSYSKTMEPIHPDLKVENLKIKQNFKFTVDTAKGTISTERQTTLEDQNHHRNYLDRIKTEQFGVLSPKTTKNMNNYIHKTSNFQKLFGSDKRKLK